MARFKSQFTGEEIDKRLLAVDNKAGVFYYDTTNNRYLVFADEEKKDEYLNDTTKVELIIGSFDAPFNYTAEIEVTTPVYNAISADTTGNYIDFTFDIKNKSGASTGEGVNVTYTFMRNANKTVVKETRRFGEVVHFNIDSFLLEGTNIVTISIVGQNTLAATTVAVTYQVVTLRLYDSMDITKVYNLSQGEGIISVPYTLEGQGSKVMEWYVDGEKLPMVVYEDEVNDSLAEKIKYIPIRDLNSGIHSLQFRAYTTIGGESFYTDVLYREFMVDNGDINGTLIAVKAVVPKSAGIVKVGETLTYNMEQYLPYNLNFAVSKSEDVAVKFGKVSSEMETLSIIEAVRGELMGCSITPSTFGDHLLRLATANDGRTFNVVVSETALDINEITEALEFSFTARGRSNTAIDKDKWNGHGYTATFDGFKWNNQSGWVDNALLIGEGASVSFDYAPLATNSISTGKTIEFEFTTRNVDNENAVICDLRNADGTGLLLTASEARLVSKVGSVVYTKFKDDDRNRISFVINRNANVTNKNLVFIYINGILSGAINYGSADNYLSEKLLSFNGTTDAQIALYDIFVYNMALSSSQILNNYILYRTTIEDMRNIYDKNDILEDGSISVDKARRSIPVMIITGNLLDLDEKSDTDYYITADIDYYNDQDPTKNFRIEGARIRIQGTSSRFYPRKNYRFYTNKADYTVLYDANGNVVVDGLYAFKDGAQAVDCWCLKADFAESSGSHNTGVARIWNEVMTNASFSHTNNAGVEVSGYPLRTQAQIAAKTAGYGKDVRTTIDGFPILLFRRDTKDDEPIFVGKYNFNNDKSTPSVFGFTGIPNFDDSKVQSWECLENEDPIALFKTVDGFFNDAVDADGKATKRWELAFEARHEGSESSVNDLYDFCAWVVSKNGKAEEFTTEKWDHMDVYKVAAYYVYLMRFGALDQVVKNCFLTSEDGVHFYFINYDNDTILGVDNTGEISAMPDVNRQSRYANGSYVYAGHESVLWNMLEADSEFMSIVRVVDTALYSAGLTYKAVLDMFNNKQSGKWVERVYNEDAQYKYVAPYTDKGVNYLSSLQGSRESHRTWWLSKRFSLYDSLFASGDFTAKAIEIKCVSGTPAGLGFEVTSGTDMNYGYGLNRVPREIGVYIPFGETHVFTVGSELGIGTPVAIYAAPYIRKLDICNFAPYINTLNIANAFDEALGSRLKSLIVGASAVTNINVTAISGLDKVTRLQELDIKGFKGITSLDLSNQVEFVSLDAIGSGLASVTFAKGAPITTLKLPSTMLAFEVEQLPKLSTSGVTFESLRNISSMRIKGCPLLSNDINFIKTWLNIVGDNVSLDMDNVAWENVNYQDLIRIGGIKEVTLKGYAKITEVSQEIIDALSEVFGNSLFDRDSDFYVDAPESIFISGPSEIIEGDSAQFTAAIFPTTMTGILKFSLVGSRTGVTIDTDTGIITTTENGYSDATLSVRATFVPYEEGSTLTAVKELTVKKRIYPSIGNVILDGSNSISEGEEQYKITYNTTDITGDVVVDWDLTGDITNFVRIKSFAQKSCILELFTTVTTGAATGTLTATICKATLGTVIGTKTLDLAAKDDAVAELDSAVCQALYDAGLCASNTYITKDEARLITDDLIGTIFAGKNIVSFEGFKYFTSVINIPNGAFQSCQRLRSISLPPNVESIGENAFKYCRELTDINLHNNITAIKSDAFNDCKKLTGLLVIPNKVTTLEYGTFASCNFTGVIVPSSIQTINNDAFYGNTSLKTVINFSGLTFSKGNSGYGGVARYADKVINAHGGFIEGDYVFSNSSSGTSLVGYIGNATDLILPDRENYILGDTIFKGDVSITSIIIPDCVTIIGSDAFSGCLALRSVRIGNGVTGFGNYVFNNCTGLEFITMSTNVATFGEGVFFNCKSLLSIKIPNSVTYIGSAMFYGCTSLKEIYFYSLSAKSGNSMFGVGETTYTGRNTYNTGENVLYVPVNATGYDTGQWLDPLQNPDKCGFTISYTL